MRTPSRYHQGWAAFRDRRAFRSLKQTACAFTSLVTACACALTIYILIT